MKINIPRMGDLLVLQKDWAFTLMHERRNTSLLQHDGVEYVATQHIRRPELGPFAWDTIHHYSEHMLPAGTVVSIDRYYIRKGAGEFDSITFYVHVLGGVKLKKKLRFFVSVDAASQAEFEFVQ